MYMDELLYEANLQYRITFGNFRFSIAKKWRDMQLLSSLNKVAS